ncbi:uncharacterized protein HMPREF1541_00958 [Cyphellophora europaea CBS 101466]|uniref:Ergosterol biosynthesis protein n=1 Tax=Cyphellophora europaea (strain CBS 101466) TaxID=1220924 RepID=W2SFU2_CYPE1|nr:uncharacterized protein HMPREF1541_00958 [Cyphellophora europaea CBS 101466]ETN46769.1 hypothetical protein HMPREF1541_00958 [Cyphellophora europaea CBS 101466]
MASTSTNTNISPYLFLTASLLNALAVPGHIIFGRQNVDPTLRALQGRSDSPTHAVGLAAARVGFEHMTVGIFAAAILNYRWSATNGPQGRDEHALFWALLGGGWWVGRRYWRVGEYGPLVLCLWGPPLCSLAAWALAQH